MCWAKVCEAPTAVMMSTVTSVAGLKVWWSGVRPCSGRVSFTVRSPSTTKFETSLTDVASRVPAQCSASDPHVPIFCSKTPLADAMSVYGASAMTRACSPTPNQPSAGPERVMVARLSFRWRSKATVTPTAEVTCPTRRLPGAHAAVEGAVLKVAAVAPVTGSVVTVHPRGIARSCRLRFCTAVAFRPKPAAAAKHAGADNTC
mmetsp:Transcript_18676/g.61095  ORF Transcript_18676/g.61095 Transcript_18676/m.61095 type:complete len:203 (+) Transcript_18676:1718-2326(+)